MLTSEQYFSVFNPEGLEKLNAVSSQQLDLVHYTSASNALRILDTEEVTLRNATLMNDFSEIDHGEKCVLNGWKSKHGRGASDKPDGTLFSLLNQVSPTIFPAIEQSYDKNLTARKVNTFLLSLAEHDDAAEGHLGKLSMWRAYGGRTNVALVVNSTFMNVTGDANGVFTAPVLYSDRDEFAERQFRMMVDTIGSNIDLLKSMDRDHVVHYLLWTLNTFALSTKHPGFREENEWRVIYAPWLYYDETLKEKIIEVQGIPQKAFTLDISPSANAATPHRSVLQLLKKIIIGPTEHPWVLFEAFAKRLEELGFSQPESRVIVSDIPIRR